MRVDLPNQIVLRWDSDSDCSGLLASGGIDAVWFPSHEEQIAAACRAAGAETLEADAIRFVGRDPTGPLPPGDFLAVKAGVWPGARASARNADGSFSGGASQRAWIDANGYLVAWTKALFPDRAPLLAYLPDSDAGIAKGQVIRVRFPGTGLDRCLGRRRKLPAGAGCGVPQCAARGDPAATAAWAELGRTARWLKENQDLLRQPALSTITVLVERGDTTAEIAALMFRQSGSPELVSSGARAFAGRVPPADRGGGRDPSTVAGLGQAPAGSCQRRRKPRDRWRRRIVLVEGAGYKSGPGSSRIEAFIRWAPAGLWFTRSRLLTRAISLWTFSILLPAAGRCACGMRPPSSLWPRRRTDASNLTLRLVNYGSPMRGDIMAQVRGVYNSATLLRPGQPSVALRTCRRGGNTDVLVPGFRRLALVVFS